eukprot:COSAG02_NODE_4200_length_5632_cov_709.492319_3_plen_57_part_00
MILEFKYEIQTLRRRSGAGGRVSLSLAAPAGRGAGGLRYDYENFYRTYGNSIGLVE